jgi:hypothetical protein
MAYSYGLGRSADQVSTQLWVCASSMMARRASAIWAPVNEGTLINRASVTSCRSSETVSPWVGDAHRGRLRPSFAVLDLEGDPQSRPKE